MRCLVFSFRVPPSPRSDPDESGRSTLLPKSGEGLRGEGYSDVTQIIFLCCPGYKLINIPEHSTFAIFTY